MESEEVTVSELCPNCGSIMLSDDEGNLYCAKCAGEINWGMDEDEEAEA